MRGLFASSLLLGAVAGLFNPARADEPAGRVHNLKILSDKIDDVTTVDNLRKSFVKPGMSDAERSRALWTAAVKYRHQAPPPNEFLAADWEAHDPVKLFNVYGYCMCCCSSAVLEALNRLDGRTARGRILNNHSVPEVFYGGGWHMFDASLLTYFPKPDGRVAAVDDIAQALADWYAEHPEYHKNQAQLRKLMRSGQWSGWKTQGPGLLAGCPFYEAGMFPARTHGWNDTMWEYDRKCGVYEYGYHVGHRALFSLRPGESFVREAGNRGLHVNMDFQPEGPALTKKAPEGDLVYLKQFLPGYRGGVVANGYHRYAADLAAGGLAGGAEVYDNVTAGKSPALHLKEGGKPGVIVVPLESPYVYLGGRLKLSAVRRSVDAQVVVSLSTNNGRTFTQLWKADRLGSQDATLDLKDRIFRRYAYWLRIGLTAPTPDGAGLEALSVENDIQHAPRTLPWLDQGANSITIAADRDPALATRTIACRITSDAAFNKNETTGTMGATFENLDVVDGACWWKHGVGTMTIPVEVPGELVSLGFSTQFRARGERDLVRALLSCDGGTTWQEMAAMPGPTPGRTDYHRHTLIPAGTRRALLRYELTGNNTIGILSFRIDADYRDPRAGGAMRPFDVVYHWTENGLAKTKRQRVDRLPSTFQLEAGRNPELVSVSCEVPAR